MIKLSLKLDYTTIKNLPNQFKSGLAKAMIKSMLFAKQQAQGIFIQGKTKHIPRPLPPPGPLVSRTGRLRASIESGLEKYNIGFIKTRVSYGRKHELGINIGKRPFLAPSFEGDNLDKIKEIILDGIIKETLK